MKINKNIFFALLLLLSPGRSISAAGLNDSAPMSGIDSLFSFTTQKALEVMQTGFNAGGVYKEVWIRDYNTFIELSAEVFEKEVLKENLLIFFRMQGENGSIIDGFVPREKATLGYDYIYSDLEPNYAGHKNTVETDQESSLMQAVYKYVQITGDRSILDEKAGDKTVAEGLEDAMEFLMNERYNEAYGLLWGATTADWGDVQPEHKWGVYLTDDTHYAIDIYDNAMFLIALQNFMELVPGKKARWGAIYDQIAANARKYLWDAKNQKFIPHLYIDGSPFPENFNEDEIFYHGGTAVAIEAGLLTKEEVAVSLQKMIRNVQKSGAASIGLTLYPAYPAGFFKNPSMVPYGYQNGGDWTWFGGRMIQQLIRYGFVEEAYEQILPMVQRVKDNDGFYEWYTIDNEPRGSGTFRGSAGVLYTAIRMFEEQQSFSFVQLSDPQLGMGGYEHDMAEFSQAVKQINDLEVDFVVICGDLVHHASDSSFTDFLSIAEQLEVPFYVVPGNHDVGMIPNDTTLTFYRDYFGKDHYAFTHKGITFIFTNTQLWKSDVGEVSLEHDQWFKTTLKNAGKDQRVVVVGHYPIFIKTVTEEENYSNLPPEKRQELLDLFANNQVVAYLTGHRHAFVQNNYRGVQLVTVESTSKNFDGRPLGFRQWNVTPDTLTHHFVEIQLPVASQQPVE